VICDPIEEWDEDHYEMARMLRESAEMLKELEQTLET